MGLHRRNSSQAYGDANSHNRNKHRKKDGHDSTVLKEGGGKDFPHEKVFHSSSSLATLLTEKSILCLLFS